MKDLQRAARIVAQAQSSKSDSWYKIKNEADTNSATVLIYDEIGYWGVTAKDFVTDLQALEVDTINLHINSPGGDVFDGIAIYSTLKQYDADINVFIDGLAASAASFIAMAGDTITIARNAMMMIHDAAGLIYGNADRMAEFASLLDKSSDNIADIYAQRAGGTTEDWRAVMKLETWYTGSEALTAKLVDSILDEDGEKDVENKFKQQLSIFNYAGRSKAPAPMLNRIVNRIPKENSVTASTGQTASTETAPGTGTAAAPAAAPAAVIPAVVDTAKHSHVFNIGGASETDYGKVQAFIDNMTRENENHVKYATDVRNNTRTQFVNQLAKDNKILATQVPAFVKMVIKDSFSDEDYAEWSGAYENVPANQLLATHSNANGTGKAILNGDTTSAAALAQHKQDLENIVARNRKHAGMTEEQVRNTATYKELQQILAAESKS